MFLTLTYLIIIGFLGLISFVGFIVCSSYNVDTLGTSLLTFILSAFLLMYPIYSYNKEVTFVRNGEAMIRINEDALKQIDEHLKDFSTSTALMNADSPFRSLTEAKTTFVSEITKTKKRILEEKMSIEVRKNSFTKYATWFVKE